MEEIDAFIERVKQSPLNVKIREMCKKKLLESDTYSFLMTIHCKNDLGLHRMDDQIAYEIELTLLDCFGERFTVEVNEPDKNEKNYLRKYIIKLIKI